MCFTKYYKNLILCGEADHYCLLCEETFHKLDDIEKHIRWEKHRKALKTQTCLSKFKNDGIYKIETHYYCQYCNHIASNMASVKQHIETATHTAYKASPETVPKRAEAYYDSGAVIINQIKTDSHQWHCIYNKRCLLCDAAVGNVLKHIETREHIIRLIQAESKFEGDNKNYRQVNTTTFQCFACLKVFPIEDLDKHWEQHNEKPVETRNQPTNGNTEHPKKIYDREQYHKLGNCEYDITKLANIQDDFFNIDIKNNELTCKQCNAGVRNSKNDLHYHMVNKHKNYNYSQSNILKKITEDIERDYLFVYEKDAGKTRHELANYGKINHIKLNAGGSKGYCTLCDRFLSAHIHIFKQHVGGAVHTAHLEFNRLIKLTKHKKGSTKTEMFSRHILKMDYVTDLDAVAVNMAFCIDRDSFFLMKRIKHGKHFRVTKCFVCDVTFKWWDEKDHCETKVHKSHVMEARVVVEKNAFIRQIKPKLYHCGLCNITVPFWETLEKHLDTWGHKMNHNEKSFVSAMKIFQKENGCLPPTKKIELGTNTNELYANMMKVLFEHRLGNMRIYTIDLENLAKNKVVVCC